MQNGLWLAEGNGSIMRLAPVGPLEALHFMPICGRGGVTFRFP